MGNKSILAASVAVLAVAAGFVATRPGQAQGGAGVPKARYMMDVSTVSGFMGNPMAAMLGRGGSSEQHELTLRLGSSLAADRRRAGGRPFPARRHAFLARAGTARNAPPGRRYP